MQVDNKITSKTQIAAACEYHVEEEVIQTLWRKQVDNKITSKTQIAGGCGIHVEEGGTKTGGRKQVHY